MSQYFAQLRDRLGQLADLGHAAALAHWDQQTMMPARGSAARAEALATLARIGHELFADDETGRLLDGAASELNGADPDGDDARLVQVTRRHWDKARRVPTELAAEQARAASVGHEAWVAARSASDFAGFAPFLQHNIELLAPLRRVPPGRSRLRLLPTTSLLDDYEPRMQHAPRWPRLFDELKAELVPVIARIAAGAAVDDSALYARFPVEGQRRLVDQAVALMGFTPDGVADRRHGPPVRDPGRLRRRAHHHPLGRGLLADQPVRRDARVRPRPVRVGDRARADAHAAGRGGVTGRA